MPSGDSQDQGLGDRDRSASQSDLNGLDRDQLQAELTRSRERYRRLTSRRSVRLALSLSKYAAPLFGRRPLSTARSVDVAPSQAGVRRIYDTFDDSLDRTTRADLHQHYVDSPHLADRTASVIIPTYNRAGTLLNAVKSVLGQSHQAFELIIVDDGSTDGTVGVLVDVQTNPRVSVVRLERGGVSRARNEGLRRATGDVVAFLDSDNRWDAQYLELMLAGMDRDGSDIGYSAMKLEQHGHAVGYRGDEFDYEECLRDNYVDLNVLCHRRDVSGHTALFDESLRRLNDWDYLLRIARAQSVSYFPFLGATYSWAESSDQLTLKEPPLYRRIVEYRHSTDSDDRTEMDSVNIFRRLSLKICIRIAAPYDERERWSDFRFARGVSQALERLGHQVAISFRDDPEPEFQDVVISLRGPVSYEPVRGCVNLLWNISHPDIVEFDEIERFELYLAASMTWPTAVSWAVESDCHTLLQATDRAEFFPRASRMDIGSDVVFVGDSRGVDRWLVAAAVEADLDLAVFGGGWEGTNAERFVRSDLLPHHGLGELYSGSAVVLNDHRASMRDFGLVSNRVFDVTASGGLLISDHMPAIRSIFGEVVTTVRSPGEVGEALRTVRAVDRSRTQVMATWVAENHSFDNRAEALLEHIEEFLLSGGKYAEDQEIIGSRCRLCILRSTDEIDRSPSVQATRSSRIWLSSPGRQLSVGILTPSDGSTLPDSAYRRIIQPLTTEIDDVSVIVVPIASDSPSADGIDALIVPGSAIEDGDSAIPRIEEMSRHGTVIVVDVGDGDDLSSLAMATQDDAAASRVRTLSALSSEVWTPSASRAQALPLDGHAGIVVVPSGLDRRLWATYRSRQTASMQSSGRLRLLYATRNWSGADDVRNIEALSDAVSDVDVELILVGSAQSIPQMSWIRRVAIPDNMTYPRYARWLRSTADEADIGIVVANDGPDRSDPPQGHVDEYLALGLVPMIIDRRGRLWPGDRGPSSSVQSSADAQSVLNGFVREPGFRARVLGESEEARTEMWEMRGAELMGSGIVSRLFDLIDRSSSP